MTIRRNFKTIHKAIEAAVVTDAEVLEEKETKKGLPKNPFDDNRVLTFEEFMIYKELTNNKPFMMSKKDFFELIPNYKILQLSINKILTNAKEKEEINALMDEYYKELVNIMYYGKK